MRTHRQLVHCLATALFATASAAQAIDAEGAAEYSERRAGLAVVVFENGELTFEQYQNGHKAEKPHHIFSGTKSFAPIVALIAQQEGLLELDEKVADTITEWQGDEKGEQITIRHLLNFTSGLKNIDRDLHSGRTPDKYAASVACPCVTEPGTKFRYGSNHLMVFGELFKRKLRAASTDERPLPTDFLSYLEKRVLEPIGCKYDSWMRDREQNPILPYGAHMTAREWGKFGLLLQRGGKWNGKRIVPDTFFDQCFEGTESKPDYGLNFWLLGKRAHERDEVIPADTYAAAGMYKQKLYVVPSRKVVAVRLGQVGVRKGYTDIGFLGRLFAPSEKR